MKIASILLLVSRRFDINNKKNHVCTKSILNIFNSLKI